MRIDEYQKWLDAQFFDEDAPAPPPAEHAPEVPAALALAYAAPAVIERTLEPPAPAPVAPPRPDPQPAAPAFSLPPTRAAEPAPAAARPSPEEDELPDLEAYLPFLRRRTAEPEAAAESSSAPEPQAAAEPEAHTEPVDAVSAPAEERADPSSAPPEVEAVAEEPQDQVAEMLAAGDADEDADEPPPVRRARRIAVSSPPSLETDSNAMWSLVPKHLKSLISMGSDEIVQNSYRRSFKETRLDLINRLLDPTLSLEETARLLNVCPTTVRRYTNRGLLTHQRTSGDQRRFKLSDVLAFLESRSQEPA